MKQIINFRYSRRRKARLGFSLIEIMVTVGLLSFIVLGLVAMFSQTQRAFTTSMAQVDVLETGRAVTDLISRELTEMAPSELPFTTNFFVQTDLQSFYKPLLQELPGSTEVRTNVIQRFYFLTRRNQEWTGIGYEVIPDYANAGVGTLYRYESKTNRYWLPQLSRNYALAHANRLLTNRVADGIVHLAVKPYDQRGFLISPLWPTNVASVVNTWRNWDPAVIGQVDAYFWSNALPAYVELEVGILEPKALERFQAIGNGNALAQRQYLSNRVAQVHLFRQRIPIRNVDPSVYQ